MARLGARPGPPVVVRLRRVGGEDSDIVKRSVRSFGRLVGESGSGRRWGGKTGETSPHRPDEWPRYHSPPGGKPTPAPARRTRRRPDMFYERENPMRATLKNV